jgi:hypothetical protein
MPIYAALSSRKMRAYADRIGAEYRFDADPDFFRFKYARYYHALRPVFDDAFLAYDQVLFVDMDVFPVEGLRLSIFDGRHGDIGMVEEVSQPVLRQASNGPITTARDLSWARVAEALYGVRLPRTEDGLPRVFNSGVVHYTRAGLQAARRAFPSIRGYSLAMRLAALPRFYRLDQNYLGVAAFRTPLKVEQMPLSWNAQVRGTAKFGWSLDRPGAETRFLHVQTHDRKHLSEAELEAKLAAVTV